MWNKFKALAFAGMFLFVLATPIIAQICAFPGKDGVNTAVSSVVNTYYAGNGTAAGTSVTLGTIRNAARPAIAVGDLIILMQMQSGNGVSFANTVSYGSGVDASAGRYEYATVKTVSGSTLTLAASRTYTPASGAGGAPSNYDRIITHIRWRSTTGNLSSGTPGDVSFTVKLR